LTGRLAPSPRAFSTSTGGFRPHLREAINDARIFVAPIESRPRQQLYASALDAGRHSETVELYLMEPLRARPRRAGRVGAGPSAEAATPHSETCDLWTCVRPIARPSPRTSQTPNRDHSPTAWRTGQNDPCSPFSPWAVSVRGPRARRSCRRHALHRARFFR
jgi:hypothetical protein